MATLRDRFHDATNVLSKISVTASYGKDSLRNVDNCSKEELIALVDEQRVILKRIEDSVLKTDEVIANIKSVVYKAIDPDKPI